jgi:hypothetical protein
VGERVKRNNSFLTEMHMGSPVVEFSEDEDEKKKQKNAIVDKVLARLTELHIHLDLYEYGIKATQNSIY